MSETLLPIIRPKGSLERPLSGPAELLVSNSRPGARERILEFFTARIRNRHTGRAYALGVRDFLEFAFKQGKSRLEDIDPVTVAAYIESCPGSVPKRHLDARRMPSMLTLTISRIDSFAHLGQHGRSFQLLKENRVAPRDGSANPGRQRQKNSIQGGRRPASRAQASGQQSTTTSTITSTSTSMLVGLELVSLPRHRWLEG